MWNPGRNRFWICCFNSIKSHIDLCKIYDNTLKQIVSSPNNSYYAYVLKTVSLKLGNAKPKPGVLLGLLKVLFSPFIPQYPKYSSYHEKLVVAKIQEAIKSSITTGNLTTTVDASALLQERIDCAKR